MSVAALSDPAVMPVGVQETKINLDILQIDKTVKYSFSPSTLLPPSFEAEGKCGVRDED